MKECKTCKVEFEGDYVNCDSCRKKRAEYMSNYYHNSNGNPNRKFRSKVPESYTKDCKMCGETFTTGNVRGSHQYKYCNDCNYNNAYSKSEKGQASQKAWQIKNGKAANKAWYLKNKPPAAKPVETECPTCKTTIINKKDRKGHGGYKKYCNPQCYPRQIKARELREKQRREGKDCQWCGKHISFENATGNQLRAFKNVKFCSKTCIQYHRLSIPKNALAARFRSEMWYVMKGKCVVNDVERNAHGEGFVFKVGEWHHAENPFDEPCYVLECQYGEECIEEDIIRAPFEENYEPDNTDRGTYVGLLRGQEDDGYPD